MNSEQEHTNQMGNQTVIETANSTPNPSAGATGGATISLEPDMVITSVGEARESIVYGEVMYSAWGTFRKNFFKLFTILLAPYIVPLFACIPVFAGYVYLENKVDLQQEIIKSIIYSGLPPLRIIIIIASFVIIFGLLWVFLQAWSVASIVKLSLSSFDMRVRESFRATKSIAWKSLGIACSIGLFTFLYAPLLLIPAVVIAVYFLIAMQIFVAEGVTIKESLLRSYTYVRGSFWKVFCLMFTWVVIAIPSGALLDTIIENSEYSPMILLAVVVRFILSLSFTAFFICLGSSIYKALKAKKPHVVVTTKFSYFVYPAILGALVYIYFMWMIISRGN